MKGSTHSKAVRKRADVVSAVPLNIAEKAEISQILTKSLGNSLVVNFLVKPEVIAGISVRVEDKAYDATLRTTIEFVKERLLA